MSWSPRKSDGQSPRHQGWRVYSHREREDAGGGVKEIMKDKDSKSKEDGLRQRDLQGPGERERRSAEKKSFAEAGRNYLMRQKKKHMTEGGRCLRLEGAALRVRVERVRRV